MNGNTTNRMEVINSYYYQVGSKDGRDYGGRPDIGLPIFTQFSVDLYEPITCFDNQSIHVSLASMQFPYSFYTTNSTNDTIPCFTTNIGTGLSSVPFLIVLPAGNYDADTLIAEMTTLFDNRFATDPTAPCTLLMTYSKITNKFQFLVNQAGFSGTFSWTSAPSINEATEQLGFTSIANKGPQAPDCVFTNTPLPLGPFIDRSNAVVNVQPQIQNLYVRTDLATDVSAISNDNAAEATITNILQKVPCWTPPNSWIYYFWSWTAKDTWTKKKSIQTISFRITDKDNNLIDTNFIHFTLTLKLDIVRRPAFLMPDNERRIDASPMLAGAGYNLGGSNSSLGEQYYNRSIYQDLIHDRGVREGYHNWMMRKNNELPLPSQNNTIEKRDKSTEEGNDAGKLKSEK